MTTLPQREEQALREVGQTTISTASSWVMLLLFVVTIASVALLEPLIGDPRVDDETGSETVPVEVAGPWRALARGVGESLRTVKVDGLLAGNHRLLASMDEFELELEEESFLRRLVLPPVQGILTTYLGVGNEQAYLGRQDWLFYRPDLDYITGRGFLEPEVLRSRILASDAWTDPPQPDPVPALLELQTALQSRGIDLIVLPTPVKPALEPGSFSRRYTRQSPPLRNPSQGELIRRLEEHGIEVVDVAPLLWQQAQASSEPQYLRADTHWTPAAVELAAEALSLEMVGREWSDPVSPGSFHQRQSEVENLGDIARMLTLPPAQIERWRQRVPSRRVVDGAGRPWRSDSRAEILLLGDSFSNVYSDPSLGWGAGAGLAEQLSFQLQRPVDRIALNAGGALAARQALQRHWVSSTGRLDGKRVVIYQFAVRELIQGDWRLLGLD